MIRITCLLLLLTGSEVMARGGLVDPTRPQDYRLPVTDEGAGEPQYQLQYLAVKPSGSTAIVNGERVKVGDHVAGARVERISPAGVRLRRAGQAVDLRMGYSNIRRKRSR